VSFSFITSLFFSILLLALTKLNFTSPLSSLLNRIAHPIIAPITFLRTEKNSFLDYLIMVPTLEGENDKLKKENNLLKIRAKKLSDLIKDQKTIMDLDSLWSGKAGSRFAGQIQPVKLVTLGNLATFTSLDFAHIRPGQPVATGNSLVGLVKSVEPPVIKVVLLTGPDTKLGVQLDTGAKGDLVYKNSQTLITNLGSNVIFNSKTTVFTLPSSLMPENLIIGRVDKIISNQADPTQEATVILDQEISTGRDFFIITRP